MEVVVVIAVEVGELVLDSRVSRYIDLIDRHSFTEWALCPWLD